MPEYTTVEEQVEYAIRTIDPARRIEISLRDLLFVHETIGELIRFFHQPAHWKTIQDVEKFMGDKDQGALWLLWEAYYRKLRDLWPEDIQRGFDDGEFEHPNSPYYYQPDSERAE